MAIPRGLNNALGRSTAGLTIGRLFKNVTDKQIQRNAFERNLKKYGDKWGPTIDYLRRNGKSWEQIIESSSRPNSSLKELIKIFFGR